MPSAPIPQASKAQFDRAGDVRLPTGYRRWQHVGTRIKPDGLSVLDETPIVTPQVMDAYVEPAAFDEYKRSGQWPDGTQIVKEFSTVKTGEGCDKQTFVCATPYGSGIFEVGYAGMGMMIKDSKRFPSQPGHWGYYSFVPDGSGYQKTAAVKPMPQCAACHMKLASDTDYVFAVTHIGLR